MRRSGRRASTRLELGAPLVMGAFLEASEGLGAVAFERGAVAAIDAHEMGDDALIVELALIGGRGRCA
jgi:hypothetical protein